MDSWFGMPTIISALRSLLPVICMVKRTPKVLYQTVEKGFIRQQNSVFKIRFNPFPLPQGITGC